MPTLPALTLLLATVGLAALAFALLFIHAASTQRDALDAAALAELTAFYLADSSDEANTKPLLDAHQHAPQPNLGEQGA